MIRLSLALFLALTAPAMAEVLNQGNGKDTFNIVIVGDGWTGETIGKYREASAKMVKELLTIDPYEHFADAFRIEVLDVLSPSKGCRFNFPPNGKAWKSPEEEKDYTTRVTKFGIVWWPAKDDDGPALSTEGEYQIDQVIGDLPCKVVIVLTPDEEVNNGVARHRPDRSYIVMNTVDEESKGDRKGTLAHELGHALFGLGDEYCKNYASEPVAPNVTLDPDPKTVKWAHLIGELGTPPVKCKGSVAGVYVPRPTCRMNSNYPYPDDFCMVCLEGMTNRVQSSSRLIRSAEPSKYIEVNAFKTVDFTVDLRPLGANLTTYWYLDGKSQGTGKTERTASGWTSTKTIGLPPGFLTPGTHEVRVLVEDLHSLYSLKSGQPVTKTPQTRWWWIKVDDALAKTVTLEADDAWK